MLNPPLPVAHPPPTLSALSPVHTKVGPEIIHRRSRATRGGSRKISFCCRCQIEVVWRMGKPKPAVYMMGGMGMKKPGFNDSAEKLKPF